MELSKLAELTGLDYDNCPDDNRLHMSDRYRIDIYAPTYGKRRYDKLMKEVNNFSIVRDKYTVYTWSDSSGYSYWKNEGECNYIRVSVSVNNSDLNEKEVEQLKLDVENTYWNFNHYHNIEDYIATLK